jgi:hypothetical protein
MDANTKRNYNLPADWTGFAVIQHGYACLGTGETAAAALADAERNMGEPIECDAPADFDGAIEVVEVTA